MKSLAWLILLFLILSCGRSALPSFSELEPILLVQNGDEKFQYWEIEDAPDLWSSEMGYIYAINAYKDSLRDILGDSVLTATIRQRKEEQMRSNIDEIPTGVSNKALIKQGYVGTIRSINYLEAEVLNYQLIRFPLFSHPTEFHGFIAQHDSMNHIRIYFGASDQPFPPKPKPIISHLEKALARGWKLTHHLHNHYEPKLNNYLGIMAPSLADVQYYRSLKQRFGLQKALITNGFTTVVLDSISFGKLNAH